ncbi:uncharacterized protein HGUI_00117 [Hanseniaspora guilliermondii]|uniref:Ketopantoate reductase C-terminal domain-containing protein n=1 Tax=Hanseniaspora guilliermondii TaxID=56406 RepID=A0A1L0CGQ8_9ASCO|nr:uncharacterized protein HGUI_00117 [Hanseniaspora guilliermondii]
MSQPACIFYGDSPTCMFFSWRISYTNISVINISNKISSDGIISWKSDKLGSNFYTPNLFIKEIFDDPNIISAKIDNSFDINYIYISCDSISEIEKVCISLNAVILNTTIIFVECNFAVDIDFHVYNFIRNRYFKDIVVISVLSDLEGRKLTSGSYMLLSDDINLYFGLSYMQNMKSLNDDYLMYLKNVNYQFNKKESSLQLFIDAMNSTNETIIHLHKSSLHTNELALRIWNSIIPRIIFNIIAIIYEDTEYIHFIDRNQSLARDLSQNTLKELVKIAFYHCDYNFELINPATVKKDKIDFSVQFLPYISSRQQLDTVDMNYDHLVSLILGKYKKLNSEQHNKDSAEFVSLSFEAYCFYHKIEFPASVMFSQIFSLSKKYSLESMCLKFLSQFYERLCILSGMPVYFSENDKKINGLESNSYSKKQSLIFGRSNISVAGNINVCSNEDKKHNKQIRKKRKEKIKKSKPKKEKKSNNSDVTKETNNSSGDNLVDDIAALYLDALDNVEMLATSAPIVEEIMENDASSDSSEYTYKTVDSSTLSESSFSMSHMSDSETESECSYHVLNTDKGTEYKKTKKSKNKTKKGSKNHTNYEVPKKTGAYESLNDLKLYFDANKKDELKRFSSVSKIMTVDVEYELMKRLSHNYEVEDRSRYSGIYIDNDMLNTMNNTFLQNMIGREVSESVLIKRKKLMQDITRFRRFKIEHSMKEGGMEYMKIMEEKLNNGLNHSTTNRFGKTDMLIGMNKKKEKKKTQGMIEYQREDLKK